MLTMQVHSHLLTHEIIGFLGGYNFKFERKKAQTVVITEAYPCSSFKAGKDHEESYYEKNVEMSPECGERIKKKIDKRGQSMVGWYHSHPVFEPTPS